MKRFTLLFILTLLIPAASLTAQCVNAGSAMSVCQGGTTGALGGTYGGSATSATWDDGGTGGTFTNNSGATPGAATYTPPAGATGSVVLTLTSHGGTCDGHTDTKTLTINALPPVSAGGALTAICQGGTTGALGGTFGGTATGAIWNDGGAGGTFSNNLGTTPNTATYTASSSAPVTVTLTLVTTGGPCSSSASKSLTVNPNPTVSIGAAVPAICQGGTTAALNGGFGGGATSAIWTDGVAGGTFTNNDGSTPGTTTYTPNIAATGSIILTLTTSGGSCGTTSGTKSVTVNVPPTANSGGALTAVCQGGTTGALGGSVGGGATSGIWDDGGAGGTFSNNGGSTPGTATYTASAGSASTVTLTLTASVAGCTSATSSKTLTVNPNPVATVGGVLTAVCQGGTTAALGGSFSGGATSAVWSDGGANGTFTNNSGTTPGTTTYTTSLTAPSLVTLTLTTSGGTCGTASNSKTLTVNPSPVANSQTSTVCADSYGGNTKSGVDLTAFNSAITGAAINRTVDWFTDPGLTVPVTTASNVTVTNAQVFYAYVTNTITGCTSSTTLTFTVQPRPEAQNPQVTGTLGVGSVVTATYTYNKGACNAESLSRTQISWNIADDGSGTNQTWIATKAGTDPTYLLSNAFNNKWIQVCVSTSDGNGLAPSHCSSWMGPIASNAKPVASSLSITGTLKVNNLLTAVYTYYDAESDPEGTSLFQWYTADDNAGSNKQAIGGATSKTFLLTNSQVGKYIGFQVQPIAVSGNTNGDPVFITVWPGTVTNDPPVASGLSISGTARVSNVLTANYTYSDTEGDVESGTTIQWYTGDDNAGLNKVPIALATSRTYTVTNAELNKYIGFIVTPREAANNQWGSPVTVTTWAGPVDNPAPVADSVKITGTKNAGDAMVGHYLYKDTEGDIENGSHYQWSWSGTLAGVYNDISGDTALTHLTQMSDTGRYFKFSVIPKTATGTTTGLKYTSNAFGPVNKKPKAVTTGIAGTPLQVGTTLTAQYSYSDPDGDIEGASKFRWFRDGVVIPGATSNTYQLTSADAGFEIGFEVTPVSATGFPNTGLPETFTLSSAVSDPSNPMPVATGVCINGTRETGQVLTGKYTYTYPLMTEGVSLYQWYRDANPISGANSITYTCDIADDGHDIFFEVTPVSGNIIPVAGLPVKSNSLPRITMTKTSYVTSDRDTLLTATPAGGYFWGVGVINNQFSAKSVSYKNSPFTVTYHLDDQSCSQNAVTKMWVDTVSLSFVKSKPYYCQNSTSDTIMVGHIPKNLVWYYILYEDYYTGNWYYNIYDSTIVFNPSTMLGYQGEGEVYFYGYDNLYSTYFISYTLNVDAVQPEKIDLPDTVFCRNDPKVKIHTVQGGGVFSGPVVGDLLDPSKAVGDTAVRYVYTSDHGCKSAAYQKIRINPNPTAMFYVADSCIKSTNSPTHFINLSTATDSIAKYYWSITDAGFVHTDSIITANLPPTRDDYYQYQTGGFHKINLSALSVSGCTSTIDKTIEFATRPSADFKWYNLCLHPSDSVSLVDTTTSDVKIVSRSWIFNTNDTIRNILNVKFPQSVGYLNIEYIVRTAFAGCTDTMRKSIYVRPTIHVASGDYFEDFENGQGSWVKNETDTFSIDRWSFGTPSRPTINSAYSGTNAWFVSYNPLNARLENSSIVSPCFDFTGAVRPMISMYLWTKFDKNRDGAALQYKVGDSKTWNYIGTLGDGINWYNSTLIQGRPGGDQVGWTAGTTADKWHVAEHKLDDLIGLKDIKFRVVYGSNGTGQDNEGLAFDNIRIGKRTRGVLLEHFTNNSSSDASTATATVSDLSGRWPADIINIQYHTNFPGSDQYYLDNPGDVSARVLDYGLSRTPYTFIDGGADKDNFSTLYDYILSTLDSNELNNRSMINPEFSMSLHGTVSSGVVSVSGAVKKLDAGKTYSNLTLYLAITQKVSTGTPGANGETKFYNVFRKFIPDAGGIAMKRTWAVNESDTIMEKDWAITNIPAGSDIEVIAFLQNNITKEVYQAAAVPWPNITTGIDNQLAGKEMALYPNPASSKLTITFDKPVTEVLDIKIYDYAGSLVRTFKTGAGGTEFVIDDLGLENGIYLVRISSGTSDYGFKKLIVSKN